MGTETSSTPQSGLSSLFAGNQSTQVGQQNALPPITAPQSLIGQLDMSQIPAMPQPVAAPAPVTQQPAAAPAGFRAIGANTNMGQGGDNWGGLMVMPSAPQASPAPAPQPAQQPYQPSRASLIAQLINSQFGKK